MTNVLDRFNRADGALGNADSGQLWTAPQWTVEGNLARRTSGSNGSWSGAEATIESGSKDVQVEAVVNGYVYQQGFILRDSGPGSHYLITVYSNAIYLYVATAVNNYAQLATGSVPIVPGDRFRVRIVGLRIQAWINNTLVIDYTSFDYGGNLNTSTRHGMSSPYVAVGFSTWNDFTIRLPLKTYDGSAWQKHYAQVWDGTKWVTRAARRWDGALWK